MATHRQGWTLAQNLGSLGSSKGAAAVSSFAKSFCAGILTLALWIEPSLADGWERSNIWWNIIINWQNRGSTVCVAEQFNSFTLRARFDVHPKSGRVTGSGRVSVLMHPFEWHK